MLFLFCVDSFKILHVFGRLQPSRYHKSLRSLLSSHVELSRSTLDRSLKEYLALGFASDIKLLDAKGHNTCNVDTAALWDTMATRAKHSTEFSKFFLDSNSGLVHLV
jgi:hypothetical protein